MKLTNATCLLVLIAAIAASSVYCQEPPAKPNIVFILTDDVGYGDLGCLGNPIIKTPELDRLRDVSVSLADFHVSPMCTPTRGSILTGLDPARHRATMVCRGRSILNPATPTVAEHLSKAGYATGLFGKWHLGTDRPHTPADRGFQETLWFRASHIGGTSDFFNNDYFDPFLIHNGMQTRYKGYITDILFDEAMTWMKYSKERERPFFAFLPLNAAHGPFWGDPEYRKPYRKLRDIEARFYGMIAQIDENVGRLQAFLKKEGLAENTILIFTSDNGTAMGHDIHNAGMRGHKRSLYDGGHRVPCFVRWPAGGIAEGREVKPLTRGTDWMPTLLAAAGVPVPADLDGMNILELLQGKEGKQFDDRFSVVQMGHKQIEHAGLVKWDAALMWKTWRMIGSGELYNLASDPGQSENVIEANPEIAEKLKAKYEAWWSRMPEDHLEYVANIVGADQEQTFLCAPDWQLGYCDHPGGHRGGLNVNGFWRIDVKRAGVYEIQMARWPEEAKLPITSGLPMFIARDGMFMAGKVLPIAKGLVEVGDFHHEKSVPNNTALLPFEVRLDKGLTDIKCSFLDKEGRQVCGAYYCYVRYLKP